MRENHPQNYNDNGRSLYNTSHSSKNQGSVGFQSHVPPVSGKSTRTNTIPFAIPMFDRMENGRS